MSGIIMKGAIASNTGEYLPTPYIDKIYIEGGDDTDTSILTVRTSVFLGNYDDKLFNNNGDIENDEETYSSALSDLNYYVMIFYGNKDHSYTYSDTEYDLSEFTISDEGLYESVISGHVNPFALYHASASTLVNTAGDSPMILQQIYPMSETPGTYYDESGNELLKYTVNTEWSLQEIDTLISTWASESILELEAGGIEFDHKHATSYSWDEVKSLKIITFSSAYDYFSNEDTFEDTELLNLPMLKMKMSEISYETVFDEGSLGEKGNTEYLDENEQIYDKTPLVSIDLVPYKINKISHTDIVNKMQELLDDYQTFYDKEKGFDKLKNMMDNISTIIETHGESENLLPQLHQLVKIFPDKAPIKPIGKFYKSFRKRVFVANKAIKNSTKLRRKVLYSSKVVDMRPPPAGTAFDAPNFDAISAGASKTGETYIYSDWVVSSYNPGVEHVETVFGHYFFDYEKALHYTSAVSQIYNVRKLNDWGLSVPYDSFRVLESFVERWYSDDGKEKYDGVIGTVLNPDRGYPVSLYTRYVDNGEITTIFDVPGHQEDSAFADTPYGDASYDEGYATSLVYREFLDPTNASYDTGKGATSLKASSIEDYRLMCFELLDYNDHIYGGTGGGTGGYQAYVLIEDSTISLGRQLSASCRKALRGIEDYYDEAQKSCVFNDELEEFNKFFIDALIEEHTDDPSEAPWIKGPVVYLMHLDLLYDVYGGDTDEIVKAATEISEQISPVNGTVEGLENFTATFQDFVAAAYGESAGDESGEFGAALDSDYEADLWYTTDLAGPDPDGTWNITTL